jgi:hypothetical protein
VPPGLDLFIKFIISDARDSFDDPPPGPFPDPLQMQQKNSKLSISEHREQYYATARKQSAQSPCHDPTINPLERIPEYSEDIYPYATFHLKDQEKMSNNSTRSGLIEESGGIIYDSRDALSTSKKIRASNSGTGRRKKPKKNKAESEEYDSLNSDSDVGDGASRTESSNCLEEATNVPNFSEYWGIFLVRVTNF